MILNENWQPGPDAVAGMVELGSEIGLVVYGDPNSLALTPPTDPAAWTRFVLFLRQLSDAAEELAKRMEDRMKDGK
ncbi:hypothetical protein [Amycolatopsis sp.]|jgi:hypothetical protein|uniref:hypothetical protein n=1 Tax=Amycolatopsis sp. TaxID=37632 RepID=UPI002DFC96AB|nr:hypothetical protein [Amycolatopsis sp.]